MILVSVDDGSIPSIGDQLSSDLVVLRQDDYGSGFRIHGETDIESRNKSAIACQRQMFCSNMMKKLLANGRDTCSKATDVKTVVEYR